MDELPDGITLLGNRWQDKRDTARQGALGATFCHTNPCPFFRGGAIKGAVQDGVIYSQEIPLDPITSQQWSGDGSKVGLYVGIPAVLAMQIS